MGSPRIKQIDMSLDEDSNKKTKSKEKKVAEKVDDNQEVSTEKEAGGAKPKEVKERSKQYKRVRGLVDRTKLYGLTEAVEMLKKTSYSKFAGTVVADIVVKDDKLTAELTFPHSTGKQRKVEVVTEALLKKIEAGEIDFDVLIAQPEQMKDIAKLAKVLGPKGLMPNPKNGTITKDPEKRKKELEGGKMMVKTEKKAPLMHVVVGKTDMKEKELTENITVLIMALNAKRMVKLVLSSTMSPGIKVDLAEFQKA
jgi:large subunit ribosomal protein L1